jgi:hypothetical protein
MGAPLPRITDEAPVPLGPVVPHGPVVYGPVPAALRLRVGQWVAVLPEVEARQAYDAHPWRHPLSGEPLSALTWDCEVRVRCGSLGTVVGLDNTNDFVFVRFWCPRNGMLSYYDGAQHPHAMCRAVLSSGGFTVHQARERWSRSLPQATFFRAS